MADAKKAREEVNSKDQFVEAFTQNLRGILDLKVSKQTAWDIFKLGMNSAFELGRAKPLSLSGIGRFSVLTSKRSQKINKPALRMRFRASSRVNEDLNGGKPFVTAPEVKPAAPAAPAAKAPAAPAPAAQATKAPAKAGSDL